MSGDFDFSRFIAVARQRGQRAIQAAMQGVDIFGEHVIGDAQQLCPVDTGDLKDSGTTTPAVIEGDKMKKVIGFNMDYAAPVHEDLEARHEVGQAKFLETAMRMNAPKLGPFLASRMKAAMEG